MHLGASREVMSFVFVRLLFFRVRVSGGGRVLLCQSLLLSVSLCGLVLAELEAPRIALAYLTARTLEARDWRLERWGKRSCGFLCFVFRA